MTFHHGQKQKRTGLQFCCLIWRLRFLHPHLLGTTSRTIIGCLSQPVLEGSANLMHLFLKTSNHSQGYCEIQVKLASSLDFWTLPSENLIVLLPAEPIKANYVQNVKNYLLKIAFSDPQIKSMSCNIQRCYKGMFPREF